MSEISSSDTVQDSTSESNDLLSSVSEQQESGHVEQNEEDESNVSDPVSVTNTSTERSSSNTLRQLASFVMASSAVVTAERSHTLFRNISTSSSSSSPPVPPNTTTQSTLSYPTLARSQSTPYLAKVFLPILFVACQILFYYGQTEPMWSLNANVTIDVWANATDYTARRTFDALGLDYNIPIQIHEEKDVQTFTYMYAVQELWRGTQLPGKVLPRLAAVLLIVFSGFWPHLKLIMLNLTWFLGRHKTRRTTTLSWLAALGKWSLADVLVVCVMVGVLNLDWIVDPGAIKDGVINDLPTILEITKTLVTPEQVCDNLLKMDCATQKRVAKIAKCKACKGLIGEAFGHPNWARSTGRKVLNGVSTNGGGVATLRVMGMRGIYYFCGAVILSIFLSLIVDILDHRAKIFDQKCEEERRGAEGYRERGGLLIGERPVRHLTYANKDNNNNFLNILNDDGMETPLLGEGSSTVPTTFLEIEVPEGDEIGFATPPNLSNNSNGGTYFFPAWFLISSLLCVICVFLGDEMFTMQRLVYGAGPQLLHDILGVDWERSYSFRTLMWTTGAAGAWDYMLMGTFGLFCVVGPVIRAVLLFLTVILDRCRIASAANLAMIVKFMGSFCAWEVFAIATVMVQLLMPSITDTIIRNPACGTISDDGSCLKMEFNLVPIAFSLVVIGGLSLVGLSWMVTKRSVDKQYTTLTGEIIFRTPNYNYERLQGSERTMASTRRGEGREELSELVFETNQV